MQEENKQQKISYYAKILIAFSLMLMIYGVFLDLRSNVRLFNPITDAKPSSNSNKTHTIIDISQTIETNNDSPTIVSPTPNTPTPVENPTETNTEPQFPSNSTQYFSESNSVPTLETINSNFRNEIQNNFGVVVKYGEETSNYEVGGLTTTAITNENQINSTLVKLNDSLNIFPKGFFQEIKEGGIPLTIYLVERYSANGVTGVTDSNAYFADISIAIAYPFEESFFHEIYHYIERYMIDRKGFNFNNWNTYNPSNFMYGNVDYNLSYASNGGREDSFFVNNYAQTADAEDRASTFEYMMDDVKPSCLNKDQPVWKKAKMMSQAIEASLNTCSPYVTEYWERFI